MATTSKRTTKISIPHTLEEGCSLVGVLEQVDPDEPTQGRKIALVRPHSILTSERRIDLRSVYPDSSWGIRVCRSELIFTMFRPARMFHIICFDGTLLSGTKIIYIKSGLLYNYPWTPFVLTSGSSHTVQPPPCPDASLTAVRSSRAEHIIMDASSMT